MGTAQVQEGPKLVKCARCGAGGLYWGMGGGLPLKWTLFHANSAKMHKCGVDPETVSTTPVYGPCGEKPEHIAPPACQCGKLSVFEPTDYGGRWICNRCQAWVGVHPGTRKPLGTLATKALRDLRVAAHNAFDPLWNQVDSVFKTRASAYAWLAKSMNLQRDKCHVALFNAALCAKMIRLCKERLAQKVVKIPVRESCTECGDMGYVAGSTPCAVCRDRDMSDEISGLAANDEHLSALDCLDPDDDEGEGFQDTRYVTVENPFHETDAQAARRINRMEMQARAERDLACEARKPLFTDVVGTYPGGEEAAEHYNRKAGKRSELLSPVIHPDEIHTRADVDFYDDDWCD